MVGILTAEFPKAPSDRPLAIYRAKTQSWVQNHLAVFRKSYFDQRVFFSATREDIGTELCWNAGVDTTEIYPVSSQTLETSKVPATSYGFYEINRYVDDFTQAGAGSNPTDFTKFGQSIFVANSSTDVDQYRSTYLMGPDLVPQIESMFLTRFFPLPNDDYYNVRELTLHNGELWFIASDKSNPESGYVWKITQNLGMFNVVNVYIPPAENGQPSSCRRARIVRHLYCSESRTRFKHSGARSDLPDSGARGTGPKLRP